MESQKIYPCSTIAKLLGLTQRRVRQLVKQGVIPKVERGKYNLIGCVRGYVTFLRRTIEQQGGGTSNTDLKKSRTDLLQVQRKNAELEYRRKMERLIDIEDVQITVNEGLAIFKSQRRSMGKHLARQIAGMTDPTAILKLLNSENDKILNATADKLHALSEKGEA